MITETSKNEMPEYFNNLYYLNLKNNVLRSRVS